MFEATRTEAHRGGASVRLPPVRGSFAALSYTHQREYVEWIDEAKKPETRARRVSQTIDRIRGRSCPWRPGRV